MPLQRIALAVSLALLAIGLFVVLGQKTLHRTFSNNVSTPLMSRLAARQTTESCQSGLVTASTSRLRVSVGAPGAGPSTQVVASADGNKVSQGRAAAGWRGSPSIRLEPAISADAVIDLCASIAGTSPAVALIDQAPDGSAVLRYEGTRATPTSWWEEASAVSTRLGYAKPWSGGSVFAVAMLLMAATGVIALTLVVRRPA